MINVNIIQNIERAKPDDALFKELLCTITVQPLPSFFYRTFGKRWRRFLGHLNENFEIFFKILLKSINSIQQLVKNGEVRVSYHINQK